MGCRPARIEKMAKATFLNFCKCPVSGRPNCAAAPDGVLPPRPYAAVPGHAVKEKAVAALQSVLHNMGVQALHRRIVRERRLSAQ